MISYQLQSCKQSHQEIHLAHTKSQRHNSKLKGSKYFTTLDLRGGYHHIPLDKSFIPKTAFSSPFGKYEYIKVPIWTGTSTCILLRIDD